ncbi:MAG: ElyC/SanA/YdcF family protein [Candidatus Spechtbacterales bacterium]
MRRVVAVLGYGPNETDWLREYVASVADYLTGVATDFVVLCGGRTCASVEATEAESMERLLRKSYTADIRVLRDEESITTTQNLEALARILLEECPEGVSSVQIFCASSHERKVRALAGRILNVPPKEIVVTGVRGRSATVRQGRINALFQNWIARPTELIALHVPALRRLLEARRRQVIKWR